MTANTGAAKIVSLSTKITVIVFWGLIFVGMIFAAILFQTMEKTTLETRERLADTIAYQIHEALDHLGPEDNLELANQVYLIGKRHPDLRIELRQEGRPIDLMRAQVPPVGAQTLSRLITFTGVDGEKRASELILQFPSLEATLHAQRTPLLIGLGLLLLVFGSVIKALLDNILNAPLTRMVATARAMSEGKAAANLTFDDNRNDEFGYVSRFINEAVEKMRESQEAAWDAKELAEVTLQSIGDGVVTTDRKGRVKFMNPVAQQMLGVGQRDAVGKQLWDIMLLVDEEQGREVPNPITQCLYENRSIELDDNCAIVRSDGERHPVEISLSPISGKGGALHGAVIVLHDVREARALQHELSYQASHDPLTGLYNRREFDRVLQRALEHTKRDGEEHALCYLDLDQFKVVNDTCGHAAGDQLLKKLTEFLRAKLRKADILARLGGDEFGVLLVHCPLARAVEVAEGLRLAIREFRFSWGDKSSQVGVSVGLVPVTREQTGVAEILSAADMACYVAKEEGRNRVHVYQLDDEKMHRRQDEMSMVSALRQALAEDRFALFAQPIVSIPDKRTTHYELLIRMRDQNGGYLPPGAFLPAAERYQLMADLDRCVIRKAVQVLLDSRAAANELHVSINVSGQSIGEEGFLAYVVEKLDLLGACARRVCFEVTETVAVNNLSVAVKFIETLKRYGCKFSLDDFGAGVSSFGYLKNLPVDYVKIDGVFIRTIHESAVDQAMVKAIAQVAGVMGMQTIAEFVENAQGFETLNSIGIDYAQGYWIEKPRPLAEVLGAAVDGAQPLLQLVSHD